LLYLVKQTPELSQRVSCKRTKQTATPKRNFLKRIMAHVFLYYKRRVLQSIVDPIISLIINSECTTSIILFHKRTKSQLIPLINCSKIDMSLCHACQLGKHTRLPFDSVISSISAPFEIIHSDVWTSPVPSISGIKYYVIYLDHFTHFLWVFPLRKKSEVFSTFLKFMAYV